MKLSLELHGTVVVIEDEKSDFNVFEMGEFFRNLLLAQGFQPNSIDMILPAEAD